ncbi:centrosomal protein of 95 kDa-like isoform X3 [Tachypleus tridentatus]|uniref:centrosomal protein of 95 kDa-like isoform X3 n=1 Tax=Tachypleus tridentatus TaxID=6853 RepID=UPI003FD15EAE
MVKPSQYKKTSHDENNLEEECLELANKLIVNCNVPLPRVSCLGDIHPALFTELFLRNFDITIPELKMSPVTMEEEVHNVQAIIDTLSLDILNISLSHIVGEDIVARDVYSLKNFLEVLDSCLLFLKTDAANENKTATECTMKASENAKEDNASQPSETGYEAGDSDSLDTEEAIALGDDQYLKTLHSIRQDNEIVDRKDSNEYETSTCKEHGVIMMKDLAYTVENICPLCKYVQKNQLVENTQEKSGPPELSGPADKDNVIGSSRHDDKDVCQTVPKVLCSENTSSSTSKPHLKQKESSSFTPASPIEPPVFSPEQVLDPDFANIGIRSEEGERKMAIKSKVNKNHNKTSSHYTGTFTHHMYHHFKDSLPKSATWPQSAKSDEGADVVRPADSSMYKRKTHSQPKKSLSLQDLVKEQWSKPDERYTSKSMEDISSVANKHERSENYIQSGFPYEARKNVRFQLLQGNRNTRHLTQLKLSKPSFSLNVGSNQPETIKPARKVATSKGIKSEVLLPKHLRRPSRIKNHRRKSLSSALQSSSSLLAQGSDYSSVQQENQNLVQELQQEFPHADISSAALKRMQKQYEKHLHVMCKNVQETLKKKSHAQIQLEEATKRQAILAEIMRKEKSNNQRLRNLSDQRQLHMNVKSVTRNKRLQSAQMKHYYDDYHLRMRSRMLRKRTQEELMLGQLFQEGLQIQKEQLRELRERHKEKSKREATQQKDFLESLENFYYSQFSLLAESIATERKDLRERAKAQTRVLQQMRRDFREVTQKEVQRLQDLVVDGTHDTHFREMDAHRIRENLRSRKPYFTVGKK